MAFFPVGSDASQVGHAGEPRKLGVKGEESPKVMYQLIEADHYINKVAFNSNPAEFKPESVILDIAGSTPEMENDFVWILRAAIRLLPSLRKSVYSSARAR